LKMSPLRVIDAVSGRWQAELFIEGCHVVFDGRAAEGVDDGDLLAQF
jgi:hypothetical protein